MGRAVLLPVIPSNPSPDFAGANDARNGLRLALARKEQVPVEVISKIARAGAASIILN